MLENFGGTKDVSKRKKLNPVLLIVLAVVLLAVGIAVWFLLTHVRVAGAFYSRNADVLDLRFANITTADYDKLRKKRRTAKSSGAFPSRGRPTTRILMHCT